MNIQGKKKEEFCQSLLEWYQGQKRDLPWRYIEDPYKVFISEIMLQQTQVDRVLPKFFEFIETYPTVFDLAASDRADVLRLWSGLGYNSRALRLRECAISVVQNHGGQFPKDRDLLKKLPGIGDYTSGAIMCFGHGIEVSFIDTNIKRILHRVFHSLEFQGWKLKDKELEALAEKVYQRGSAYDYHQALMDLGATICKAAKPQCELCPLLKNCSASKEIAKNPKILESRKSYKKKTLPFKQTKRFIRGGLVEYLRNNPQGSSEKLLLEYVNTHLRQMKPGEFEGILGDLHKEGVVQKKGSMYTL